jgi:hypothetical protein
MSTRKSSGLALIEALMALAVMAFGLLALVGVQSNLRQNADTARQRSEAIRIAQEEIEKWRAFTSLNGGGTVVYGNLESDGSSYAISTEYGLTAQFNIAKTVFPASNATPTDFRLKTLTVDVTWLDRNNESQSVRLTTALHGVAPELPGTLAILPEGTPTSLPGGRNMAIPWDAVRLDGAQSAWRPPQGVEGALVWRFSNDSGMINALCTVAANLPLTSSNLQNNCTTYNAQFLAGYVYFADSSTLATATQAMSPTGIALTAEVWVHKTAPVDQLLAPNQDCFTETPSPSRSYVTYYCAVPVDASSTGTRDWSGYSYVTGSTITGTLGSLSVCRYTRYRDDRTVNSVNGSPTIKNIEHPRAYYRAAQPLPNQNFLVVGTFYEPDPTGLNCPYGAPLPADTTTYPQPATAP